MSGEGVRPRGKSGLGGVIAVVALAAAVLGLGVAWAARDADPLPALPVADPSVSEEVQVSTTTLATDPGADPLDAFQSPSSGVPVVSSEAVCRLIDLETARSIADDPDLQPSPEPGRAWNGRCIYLSGTGADAGGVDVAVGAALQSPLRAIVALRPEVAAAPPDACTDKESTATGGNCHKVVLVPDVAEDAAMTQFYDSTRPSGSSPWRVAALVANKNGVQVTARVYGGVPRAVEATIELVRHVLASIPEAPASPYHLVEVPAGCETEPC